MVKQQEQTLLTDKLKKVIFNNKRGLNYLQEEEPPKNVKISIIANYFGKKSSVSSDDSKSTTDNHNQGCNVSKMVEKFRVEYEDEDLFLDVYKKKGFSYGGEPLNNSLEYFTKKGFSYEEETIMDRVSLSPSPDVHGKKSFIWF